MLFAKEFNTEIKLFCSAIVRDSKWYSVYCYAVDCDETRQWRGIW